LILLPETALPLFNTEVPPEYLEVLAQHARANGGDLLLGVPEYIEGTPPRYYNSVMSLGTAPVQTYRKFHLVPFGDYFPRWFFITWVMNALDIPMSDFSRGAKIQKPIEAAGQRIAANVCYEDAFGEELIRQLPEATLLANFTNDAWWGNSVAAEQHLQKAQMRALEAGRYMLRATNTGVTAIIDERGQVRARLPGFVTDSLTGAAQGFAGATPYVRWGNWPALIAAWIMLVAALGARRTWAPHAVRKTQSSRGEDS
jgi:apolipoprotein N-acyltransferase